MSVTNPPEDEELDNLVHLIAVWLTEGFDLKDVDKLLDLIERCEADVRSEIIAYTTNKIIEAIDILDYKMFDINSTEWGIPTKWSKEEYGKDNYADLWTPNEAIHEVIDRYKTELKDALNHRKDKDE